MKKIRENEMYRHFEIAYVSKLCYLKSKLLHSVEITEIYSDRDQKKKFRENSVI